MTKYDLFRDVIEADILKMGDDDALDEEGNHPTLDEDTIDELPKNEPGCNGFSLILSEYVQKSICSNLFLSFIN